CSPACSWSLPFFASLAAGAAEQLIERHRRRNIQYRWIFRLIFRQNTVRLCTSRPPADGYRKAAARPWSTSMKPAKVHVKGAHGPLIATKTSQYPISLDIPTKYCTLVHLTTTGRLKPNL